MTPPTLDSLQGRRTISFGPEYRRPSWEWIGFNLARASAARHNVRLFRPSEPISPATDVLVIIRKPLPPQILRTVPPAAKIIYAPFDYHTSLHELRAEPFLRHAHALIAHSLKQQQLLQEFHPNVHFLLHDDKYVLPAPIPYREHGPILWLGPSTMLPLLRRWLRNHPLPDGAPLIALTDRPGRTHIPGNVLQVLWTPVNRFDWMNRAKAALDLRGNSFLQVTRPVEKIHTFLASGIPTASDGKIEVAAALRAEGFELAHAGDPDHWLSRGYYENTAAFSGILRPKMQLSSIAATFEQVLQSLN